jgi:type I site-specific restriction endonuclease
MTSAHDEPEYRTRRQRIDPLLRSQGWIITPFSVDRVLAEYDHYALTEYPTDNGPADYALVVAGQLLGVVEAKKVSLGPQNVLVQAERYSRGATASPLDFQGFHVPFLYSTNGEDLWFHDIRNPLSRSRRIANFHTPAALLNYSAGISTQPEPGSRPMPITIRSFGPTSARPMPPSSKPSPSASGKCSLRWPPAPARRLPW